MHRQHTLGLLPSGRAVFDTHIKAAGSKPVPKAAAWDG